LHAKAKSSQGSKFSRWPGSEDTLYGWSSTANAAETITLRFPSAQLLVDLFGAANCDLLSKGGLRKDKPTAPGL